MSLISDKPQGLGSTNSLDQLPDDLLATPPAYYAFSQSPGAIEDPLSVGDTATLVMRVRCVGQHGPVMRKDGELRYKRDLSVQAVWVQGDPEPPDENADQPGLFDADETGDDSDDQDADVVDINGGVDRPEFSGAGE